MSRKLKVLVLFDTAGTPPVDQDFTDELKTEDRETERRRLDFRLAGRNPAGEHTV